MRRALAAPIGAPLVVDQNRGAEPKALCDAAAVAADVEDLLAGEEGDACESVGEVGGLLGEGQLPASEAAQTMLSVTAPHVSASAGAQDDGGNNNPDPDGEAVPARTCPVSGGTMAAICMRASEYSTVCTT